MHHNWLGHPMLYHRDQEPNLSLHWWPAADGKSHWFEKAAALHVAAHLPDDCLYTPALSWFFHRGATKGRSLGVLGGVPPKRPAFILVTTSHAVKHVFCCFHNKLVAGIVVPSPLSLVSARTVLSRQQQVCVFRKRWAKGGDREVPWW